MEENTVEVQVDDSSVSYTEDVLYDGWDDDVVLPEEESTDEETVTADQPAESEAQPEETPSVQEKAPETEEPKAEEPKPDTDQYLELKHLDEVRKVSKDEAKVLAQKGMDYDRIRSKLGEAEEANAKLKTYESFLNEIKGDFKSLDDLMADTRARIMSDKDGISYEDALSKVKAANQQAEQEKAQAKAQPQLSREEVINQMRQDSFNAFFAKYPGIDGNSIPNEVWEDMQYTNNLVVSYEKYTTNKELKTIKEELDAIKQNKKNEERAVGSLKNAGTAKPVDKYLEGWDDDY